MNPGTTFRESLNGALNAVLADDERVHLLGEDIVDPYGGAFKVTAGLSTRYPRRVRSTPVSEAAIVGLATGMALAGLRPIVEIMFADFLTLGFDQLFNHATKFPRMYDGRVRCPIIVRTPAGGGRGYGPTHSQSPEKFFLGVPGLVVAAANRYADPLPVLRHLQEQPGPSLYVEHKTLYAQPMWEAARATALGWRWKDFQLGGLPARSLSLVPADECQLVVVAYGESARRLEEVVLELALDDEIFCLLVCPTSLNPQDLDPLWEQVREVGRVAFVEEGTQGWNWGTEWAYRAQLECGKDLKAAPGCIASRANIIPCGVGREAETIPTARDLAERLRRLARA